MNDLMSFAYMVGVVAAIVWVILPVVYWATAPDWRKTKVGRSLMYLLGSTSALFLLLLTVRLFGQYPGRAFVHAAVYALVLVAGLRLAVLFVQLRIELERLIRADLASANDK
jgi:hypothetical protein